MKKISILLSIILLLQVCVRAQDENPKVQFAVRAGLNGSILLIPSSTIQNESSFGYLSNQKLKIGATAGLVMDVRLREKLYLQTGVLYSWQRLSQIQNAQYSDTMGVRHSFASNNLYTTHHVKVPLMIFFHSSEEKNHFVAGAGLFVDVAMAGKLTYYGSEVLTTEDKVISNILEGELELYKPGKKEIYYCEANDNTFQHYTLAQDKILQRLDFGVGMELGYQISQFYIGVHADFGLLNSMNPKFTQHKYVQRNLNFQVMLGYKIN